MNAHQPRMGAPLARAAFFISLLPVLIESAASQGTSFSEPAAGAVPGSAPEAAPLGDQLPPAPAVDAAIIWADWSGDGQVDVWAIQPDGSGLLLENAGDGTFIDRTAGSGLARVSGIHSAAWADVDGDGRLDVFLGSWSGPSYLFLQTTDGAFVDVTRASGLSPHARPVEAEWVDFNSDGIEDLHLASLREDIVYRGLGRAQFERVDLGLVPRVTLPGVLGVPAPPTPGASGAGSLSITPSGSTSAPASIGSIGSTSASPAGSSSFICAGSIEDVASGACLNASSVPQIGHLYPLSSNLFVSGSGFVGLGTTTGISERLTVAGNVRSQRLILTAGTGTAPMTVGSTTRVDNLNADLLDGLSASSFLTTGTQIGSGNIQNGSIVNADIAGNAAIEGTKISPSFGSQFVTASPSFAVGRFAVRGDISGLQATGFLGAAGEDDFAGYPTADWNTLDIGVAGLSTGTSTQDNVGVLGHSSYVGVRGEYSGSPLLNYGELGLNGVGLYAKGTAAAAQLEGLLEVTHSSRAMDVSGGTTTFSTGIISNPNGGPALRVQSETVGATSTDPCLNVNTQNRGQGILITQSNPSALLPGVAISTFGTSTGHRALLATKSGAAPGAVAEFRMASSASTGAALVATTAGSGSALSATSSSGISVDANKTSNTGVILQARNGADVEFRVDSTGNAFCDGGFTGGGADYAEWLPVAAGEVAGFHKGDVVGVHGGAISHDLEGADTILVISTNPCLVGNNVDAETTVREGHEVVAFLGQVPVRMRGKVRAGDLVLPSGLDDGTAVAVAPEDLDAGRLGDVIGRAWASADPQGAGVHRIVCGIGLERDRVAALALEAVRAEMEELRGSLDSVAARLDALEAR